MKSRTQLWKEISLLQAISNKTPEILKQIEELKIQRQNTPRIDNREHSTDTEQSAADDLLDYWHNKW